MALDPVLIANRGEIACRIIRTARELGLRTIAVYSEADAGAPHVRLADDAVLLGPGPANESYLSADKVLEAARKSGARAIHPGYGFLSENAAFARSVENAGLVFVGPSSSAIEKMGNKAEARQLMIKAGVPCVPGYQGDDQSPEVLTARALEIGLPVMVKAAAGGGGRGIRLVDHADHLSGAIDMARAEALNAFGSDELIIEKAISAPRHVEIQVFADAHGNIVHLGERDCSVQRRHQKVLEEAPCPIMTPGLRDRMGKAATEAARAVNYCGAGTVEFLLDSSGEFYFLEMNTRLQVEHPVTELVTGLDLVALQLAVADGAALPFTQEDVHLTGHAIEVRLYAEDPARDFLPVSGTIDLWQPAGGPGIRIDAGVETGQQVSPFYDAMLAKIIAYGDTRDVALSRLRKAVRESVLLGLQTNSAFLADVLDIPEFAAGQATTSILGQTYPDGYSEAEPTAQELALAAALLGRQDQERAFEAAGYVSRGQLGWASVPVWPSEITLSHDGNGYLLHLLCTGDTWQITVDGQSISVQLADLENGRVRARINGQSLDCTPCLAGDRVALAVGARRLDLVRQVPGTRGLDRTAGGRITAPMPGILQSVSFSAGQSIAKGDTLAVVEAMKMQHPLTAPFAGRVRSVLAEAGQQLSAGELLMEIEEEPG